VYELYRAPAQHYLNHAVIASAYSFPLSLSRLQSVPNSMPCLPSPPSHTCVRNSAQEPGQQLELFFRAAHANYWALAWITKGATRADRLALASVVASIEPA